MKPSAAILSTTALTLAAGTASAIDLTFVSWGGAYQNSQVKAYAEPYMAGHPDVKIVWDESSSEAVAKLRAMNEAGDLTWDLVDVTIVDAMRLCDEGLAMEVDIDAVATPDGTPASEDFGTDTQRLADQAKYISYGPARESSAPLVGKHVDLAIDMVPHMPTDPANATNIVMMDFPWWADHRDDLDAKFQAWLA